MHMELFTKAKNLILPAHLRQIVLCLEVMFNNYLIQKNVYKELSKKARKMDQTAQYSTFDQTYKIVFKPQMQRTTVFIYHLLAIH